MTMCAGECYLIKQFNKAKKHQEKEKSLSAKLEFNFLHETVSSIHFQSEFMIKDVFFAIYSEGKWLKVSLDSPFQPPRLV